MLLRLAYAYLGVTNAFAMLRLLPTNDREKDVEILALRHQLGVLERQLNGQQVRLHASDRAFLASLLHGLPREVLRRMRLLVRAGHGTSLAPRSCHPPTRCPVPAEARRPAERASSTWADFLRSQADALLACDFFETVTLSGTLRGSIGHRCR